MDKEGMGWVQEEMSFVKSFNLINKYNIQLVVKYLTIPVPSSELIEKSQKDHRNQLNKSKCGISVATREEQGSLLLMTEKCFVGSTNNKTVAIVGGIPDGKVQRQLRLYPDARMNGSVLPQVPQ